MGHERLGTLPKTQRWQQVIRQISDFSISNDDVAEIVRQTTQNVRSRFRNIHIDSGVQAAFKSLVILPIASGSQNPQQILSDNGIEIPANPTPLSFAKGVRELVTAKRSSLEYGQIAQSAAADAIAIWYEKNRDTQASFFERSDDPLNIWRKARSGAGFCELARLFFAKFTERYLNYFLEREASSHIRDFHEREQFSQKLREHVDVVSKHAFETAKITQSFAAGWFNKYATEGIPSDKEVESFLFTAFGKISEELRREGDIA